MAMNGGEDATEILHILCNQDGWEPQFLPSPVIGDDEQPVPTMLSISTDQWEQVLQSGYTWEQLRQFVFSWGKVDFSNHSIRIAHEPFLLLMEWEKFITTPGVNLYVRRKYARDHDDLSDDTAATLSALVKLAIQTCHDEIFCQFRKAIGNLMTAIHSTNLPNTKFDLVWLQDVDDMDEDSMTLIAKMSKSLTISKCTFQNNGEALRNALLSSHSIVQKLCIGRRTDEFDSRNLQDIFAHSKIKSYQLQNIDLAEREFEGLCSNKHVKMVRWNHETSTSPHRFEWLLRLLDTNHIESVHLEKWRPTTVLDLSEVMQIIGSQVAANKTVTRLEIQNLQNDPSWQPIVGYHLHRNKIRQKSLKYIKENAKEANCSSRCILLLRRHPFLSDDNDFLFSMMRNAHMEFARSGWAAAVHPNSNENIPAAQHDAETATTDNASRKRRLHDNA